jgi:hypothetical protein
MEITESQLMKLWNAIEYTRGTISSVRHMDSDKPDWGLCHKGRACQSMAFLDQAKDIINKLRKELKNENSNG